MQSLAAMEVLRIPFMLGGSFNIWDEAGDWNYEKLNFWHFEAATALKPPFQSCGALRSRAMFKYNLQREASALEVILHQGQTAHDGPANLQEKWPTKIDFSENP